MRRREPSEVDRRRLRDGAAAKAHPEPKTRAELVEALRVLHDGIAALQSTDDLGTDSENEACWNDMVELERRWRSYKEKLEELDCGA